MIQLFVTTLNSRQWTDYSKGGTNVSYAYNEDGLRTQKTHNGTTTNYYYNGSVLIGMQKGSTVQRFSYDAQGKVVAVDYSENGGSSYTTYYYLRNAQGDIVKLIDNGGDTKVEYTYDSWGKLLSTTGDQASGVGSKQPFRYRGYVYDTETGWYYLQSRYYDPNTCRFISGDIYLSTGQGVIGHNSYAYCLNTPVNGHDSDGEKFRPYSVGMTDNGGGYDYYNVPGNLLRIRNEQIMLSKGRERVFAVIDDAAIVVAVVTYPTGFKSVATAVAFIPGLGTAVLVVAGAATFWTVARRLKWW